VGVAGVVPVAGKNNCLSRAVFYDKFLSVYKNVDLMCELMCILQVQPKFASRATDFEAWRQQMLQEHDSQKWVKH